MTNPNKMLPRELGWLTSLLALGLVISCADETTFDPSAPASGPGELVGRDEPLNQSFQGGASPDIDARAVAEPDWQVCDAECQAYCAAQPFANPIDEAICPALWGAGFDTLDVNAGQACRRLYADLKGRFPSLAEVQADCEGQPIADVALRLLKQDSFVHVHQRRYADTLRYNNVALNLERLYDADVLVGKLHKGLVRFDEFVEVVSAHPVLTRRFDTAGDRAGALFDLFVGRPPFDNERADIAKLYHLWANGYHDHPQLGLRVPDSYIEHHCTTPEGEMDEDTAGACTSIKWGFNRVVLRPDFRSVGNLTWSGNLTEEEWRLLQTPGRIIGAWPEVWEKAVSDVLELYLGYDLGKYTPFVVQKLVEYVLAHEGDIRAAHYAVVTSQIYLQSSHCVGDTCTTEESEAPPWTYGSLRQVEAEQWVDSLRHLTAQGADSCDHRVSNPGALLEGSVTGYEVIAASRWKINDEDQVDMRYANLVKTLGGCPDNEVSGRFKAISILNTATQEGYANNLCRPSGASGGLDAKHLLPPGVSASTEISAELAKEITANQVGLFFGRHPNDEELSMAEAGASACVPKPCDAESFARVACYAFLSSSEMLFY